MIGSVILALLGIIMFFGSFVLIWWNEGDAVNQKAAISELEDVAIPDVNAEVINPDYEGKLVHIIASATTTNILHYPELGVGEVAIRLKWDGEIFQWTENQRKQDDRTVYDYDKEWVSGPVDSSRFHRNGGPGESYSNHGSKQSFPPGAINADKVEFGAFLLPHSLVNKIDNYQPVGLDASMIEDLHPNGTLTNNTFYTSDPDNYQIGDERVTVSKVASDQLVTVMAQQNGNSFSPYITEIEIEKELLYPGALSKEEVIEKQRFEAALKRWGIRTGGFMAMWIGLAMVFKPFRAVVSFIPFASRLLGGAVMFVTFFIAAALSLLTIGVSWILVRPGLAGALLVLAAVSMVLVYRAKSKEPSPAS